MRCKQQQQQQMELKKTKKQQRYNFKLLVTPSHFKVGPRQMKMHLAVIKVADDK